MYFLIFDFLVFILCILCVYVCVCVKKPRRCGAFFISALCFVAFHSVRGKAIFLTFGRISQRAATAADAASVELKYCIIFSCSRTHMFDSGEKDPEPRTEANIEWKWVLKSFSNDL